MDCILGNVGVSQLEKRSFSGHKVLFSPGNFFSYSKRFFLWIVFNSGLETVKIRPMFLFLRKSVLQWKGVYHTMYTKAPLLLLCLGLVLLAGCGYNGNTPTSTGNSAMAAGTPSVTPGATATATAATPAATRASGSGGVTIQLSASGYHARDTIVVTIANGTSQTIAFPDHQSNCTIVLLQRQSATSWQPVSICREMILTRILTLGAGKSQIVSLHAPGNGWQTGTYRVTFGYGVGANASAARGSTVSSLVFQVN